MAWWVLEGRHLLASHVAFVWLFALVWTFTYPTGVRSLIRRKFSCHYSVSFVIDSLDTGGIHISHPTPSQTQPFLSMFLPQTANIFVVLTLHLLHHPPLTKLAAHIPGQ